jgi:hypothetical protein
MQRSYETETSKQVKQQARKQTRDSTPSGENS